jgi:hypothetical protein
MIRLHVICEGQTEEAFVNELLVPAFLPKGIELRPSLIGRAGHKGGRVQFDRLKFDIRRRLLGDQNAYCTTFFDFYALSMDFPGKIDAERCATVHDKAACIQRGMVQELTRSVGENALRRFIPYVQMHEYEALLFSHPAGMAKGFDRPDLETALQRIRDEFDFPEQINERPTHAPSMRIQNLVLGYQKPLHGVLAALEIKLAAIRQECSLFGAWLNHLETLAEGNLPQSV